jgi:hypothetical protein
MEPKGSLPHSQQPATPPYPQPAQSSPFRPSQFLKIRFNIILPSMSGFSEWSLFLRFPHQNSVSTSPVSQTCYVPSPSHSLLITRIIFGKQYRQLSSSLCSFLQTPVSHTVASTPKYLPRHPLPVHQPTFLPQCDR